MCLFHGLIKVFFLAPIFFDSKGAGLHLSVIAARYVATPPT